jgi:hypothetical protein
MRKYPALAVGTVLFGGGLWGAFFLLFEAARIPVYFAVGVGILLLLGGYMLWETLRDWKKLP